MHYNRDARRVVRPMETEGLFMEVSETENKAKTVKKKAIFKLRTGWGHVWSGSELRVFLFLIVMAPELGLADTE